MAALSLSLLGPFAAWLDGRALVKFRTSKVQALLIYLAVESEPAHRRDFLMELLWPGLPQPSAQANLRQTLYQLNRAIGEVTASTGDATVPLLLGNRQAIQINPDGAYEVDVASFTNLLKGEPTPEQLKQAVALYRGDFLADFYLPDSSVFEEWAAARREALRRAALEALERLADYSQQQADYEAAERYARRQLAIDNMRESAHRQLMSVLAQSGRRRAALSHYETVRQLLEAELGITPSTATHSLYEAIRAGEMDASRRSPTAESHAPPHNLPPPTTGFVGRKPELRLLGQHLADPDVRLITILGPGGVGKTRLALATAEVQLNSSRQPHPFAHGVYFVGLARLDTADLLVPAIATALHFRFYEGVAPKEQLLNYLRGKEMLLVLDNFEHLRAGAGLIDEIVTSAPGIKLLVTSREKLNRQAEQLFPISGLDLPEADTTAASDVAGYSAIQLFGQSARRVRPDFVLTAENQADVLHVCHLVAGMPLGIVLAAAWLELLTPAEIVVEMSRDLDFLATEMGDVPERQRSLRAAFNHSWRLLSEREQAVCRQLSIFRGGCTREAAEAITGATLRDLQRLVNKSLLQRAASGRYVMHELLRQFAAEKLAQAPESEAAVRDGHSAYYCAFLHQHTDQWHTDRQLETLAAVTRESDNVAQAWRRALARGEWRRLVQAIDSWGWFLDWQGRFADGKSFCQAAIAQVEKQTAGKTAVSPDCLRLWAKALAWLGWFTTDGNVALGVLQQSLALLERPELSGQDTRQERAFAHLTRAYPLLDVDQHEAQQSYEQCLALYQELGDQWGVAASLEGLGGADWRAGNFVSALDRAQAALIIRQDLGGWRVRAESLNQLGLIHMSLGHLDEAEQMHREASSLSRRIGDQGLLVVHELTLAHTLLCQGKFGEAKQLAGESLVICQELGHRPGEGWAHYVLCESLIHTGHYHQAQRQVALALPFLKEGVEALIKGSLYKALGQLALVAPSYPEAEAAFAESIEMFREAWPRSIGEPLAGLGFAAFRLGQLARAHRHLAEALASALITKTYWPLIHALPGVVMLLAHTGDTARAVEIWALAKRHPFVANSKWFEDVAGRELETVAASMPPEVAEAARARGRALDLWETAAVLLAELEAMSIAEQDLIV